MEHSDPGAPPAESDARGGSHHKIQAGARPVSRRVLSLRLSVMARRLCVLVPSPLRVLLGEKGCRGLRSGSPLQKLQRGKRLRRPGRDASSPTRPQPVHESAGA
ncbi:hypothetical protein NDU88_000889 [Pleurodeles waltl]|uniref:Uncharacterized protein n=1 Tax=Pleurodeles waltl TaxID=8319 RepID=A0AAV7Q4E2_PLEWA|nr:hypothetical protein NDU88_000889 [Pleurodeles waltl]